MTGIDDPQVIADGFMMYDTCFSPWSMDAIDEHNMFIIDYDKFKLRYVNNKFWKE